MTCLHHLPCARPSLTPHHRAKRKAELLPLYGHGQVKGLGVTNVVSREGFAAQDWGSGGQSKRRREQRGVGHNPAWGRGGRQRQRLGPRREAPRARWSEEGRTDWGGAHG